MALANYTDLQAAALNIMDRAGGAFDVAAAPEWITLAEARLNRELGAVETDTTLTGTIDSRRIDISGLSIVEPIALLLAETGRDELLLTPMTDGTFPYVDHSGRPNIWSIDGTNIDFDRPLDQAYPFRFRFRERFDLATSTTNWLLTNHPDVYLAATLMWGAGYHEEWDKGSVWKSILDEGITGVRRQISRKKPAVLVVDPALQSIGKWFRYGWTGTDY